MCRSYKIDTRTSAEYCGLTVHLPFTFSLSSACFAIFISLSLRYSFQNAAFSIVVACFLILQGSKPRKKFRTAFGVGSGLIPTGSGSGRFETFRDFV